MEKESYSSRATCHMCFHQCAVIVHVEDGRVVKVEPDANRPFHPTRECLRKAAWLDFHNHPKRLNYPLKRKGERGEEKWEHISWGEAMDEIASKVGDIKSRYGPESITIMGGTAHGLCDYSAWRWGNLFGTPNMFYQGKNCGEAELLAECATYGWHSSQAVRPGITQCAIVWGQNPAESFQGMGAHDRSEGKRTKGYRCGPTIYENCRRSGHVVAIEAGNRWGISIRYDSLHY